MRDQRGALVKLLATLDSYSVVSVGRHEDTLDAVFRRVAINGLA